MTISVGEKGKDRQPLASRVSVSQNIYTIGDCELNIEADLVAAEWTGVKLRVTEAWDENNAHSGNALHHEGRAADVTTFPVDGEKLGRLARLAVTAGCNWVFFEDIRHVHVSMNKI